MEEVDKGCPIIRTGVSGWMFLLVPAYPGCPGQKAVKWLCVCVSLCVCILHQNLLLQVILEILPKLEYDWDRLPVKQKWSERAWILSTQIITCSCTILHCIWFCCQPFYQLHFQLLHSSQYSLTPSSPSFKLPFSQWSYMIKFPLVLFLHLFWKRTCRKLNITSNKWHRFL